MRKGEDVLQSSFLSEKSSEVVEEKERRIKETDSRDFILAYAPHHHRICWILFIGASVLSSNSFQTSLFVCDF